MLITIRKRRWRLRFCRLSKDDGQCDAPDEPDKEIRIDSKLRDREALEVLLHEAIHAAHWDLDEDAVDETAADLARLLWRVGYRRNG